MYENYVELNNNIVKICDCFTAPEDAGAVSYTHLRAHET